MKILYIAAVSNQISGGTSVMNRNLQVLQSVPNADVVDIRVKMQSKINALIAAFTGGNFILSRKDERMILKKVQEEHFDYVFQEGTSSGHLAKQLHRLGTKLIVFAHNVETMLYEERLSSYRFNPIETIKFWSIKRNEKKSVRHCYKLVTLTSRDSDNFLKKFERKADAIIPISFASAIKEPICAENQEEHFCLFVGSNFFPNVEGMNWFIKNVVPFINMKVKVVGSCCNGLAPIPEFLNDKVEYLGLVDDLSSFYQHATIVIAPIFKGSGMKTKTVEAMSYGKTIIGTNECFQGINCDYTKIGALCNTAEEFIVAINNHDGSKHNKYTADLFESYFSNKAVQPLFKALFEY